MKPTCIETPRLRLRGVRRSDADDLLALGIESGFVAGCGAYLTQMAGVVALINWSAWVEAERGFGAMRIERRCDGQPVGICSLSYRREVRGEDIGYGLHERHWSSGYAFEAASAVLSLHWQRGGRVVHGLTRPGNLRSQAILRKLGLRPFGSCTLGQQPHTWFVAPRPAEAVLDQPWL